VITRLVFPFALHVKPECSNSSFALGNRRALQLNILVERNAISQNVLWRWWLGASTRLPTVSHPTKRKFPPWRVI